MPTKDTLWELAIKKVENEEQTEQKKREQIKTAAKSGSTLETEGVMTGAEANVLFMGVKNSGKTSLILRFLEKNESPKPTTALEYTFGRKSRGPNLTKDIGHLWELGGGASLSQLLSIAIKPENVLTFSFILVVDMSQPSRLWNTVETLMKRATDALYLACPNQAVLTERKAQAFAKLGCLEDKQLIDPFPAPLLIVGMKYDIFQEFDSEKRKIISRALRFLAHHYGGHLLCCSSKTDTLISKVKMVAGNYAFGSALSLKPLQLDFNKPLCVSFGADDLKSIGFPPIQDSDIGKTGARTPLELWRQTFNVYFPQESVEQGIIDDPSKDPQYREPAIDNMRAQKDKELSAYKKKAERKMKSKQLIGPAGDARR